MTPEEHVDMVARTICEADIHRPWADVDEPFRKEYRAIARAVLDAQAAAGLVTVPRARKAHMDEVAVKLATAWGLPFDAIDDIYRAMISAATGEG